MPFRGIEAAKKATRALVSKITHTLTEQTVTEICIIGAGEASVLTPVATSLLINSQYRWVKGGWRGYHGRVGYTAEYAAAVNAAKGTLLGTNTPRSPATLGNVWGPGAEPDFLRKGFEREGADAIQAAIKRGMKL